jgi:hypothetical protein
VIRILTLKLEMARTNLRVCLDFEPPTAQVAFTSKGVDGRREIVSDFLLLGVITNAHANMVVACATEKRRITMKEI